MIVQIPIADVKVGERYREDLGDIEALAKSMNAVGLMHPILVTKDKTLVVGRRRLEAAKSLGHVRIEARVVDAQSLLVAERDENEQRKSYTPSEAARLGKAIEEEERRKAEERRRQKISQARKAHTQSEPDPRAPREFVPDTDGFSRHSDNDEEPLPVEDRPAEKSRAVAARQVHMSPETFRKATEVIEAADADPELYGDLIPKMDEEDNVAAAHAEMIRRRNAHIKKRAASVTALPTRPPAASEGTRLMEGVLQSIQVECVNLGLIRLSELDPTRLESWETRLRGFVEIQRRFADDLAQARGAAARGSQARRGRAG